MLKHDQLIIFPLDSLENLKGNFDILYQLERK